MSDIHEQKTYHAISIDKLKAVKFAIEKARFTLIKKAKLKGLYENFGQKECQNLSDNYHTFEEIKLILEFENWCMNFNLNDLKN